MVVLDLDLHLDVDLDFREVYTLIIVLVSGLICSHITVIIHIP